MFQAKINGRSVPVYISQEALDHRGVETCKSIAEDKLEAATVNGEPPKRVQVLTSDFVHNH